MAILNPVESDLPTTMLHDAVLPALKLLLDIVNSQIQA